MAVTEREAHTGAEIQAEVSRLVQQRETRGKSAATPNIPPPQRLADGQTEPNGSNWIMNASAGSGDDGDWVSQCIAKVQSKWDVQEGE